MQPHCQAALAAQLAKPQQEARPLVRNSRLRENAIFTLAHSTMVPDPTGFPWVRVVRPQSMAILPVVSANGPTQVEKGLAQLEKSPARVVAFAAQAGANRARTEG